MDNILNMETEINDILKNSDTAKRYVSGKKLNSKVEMAIRDIENNHNTSWAIEIYRRNKKKLNSVALKYRGNLITYCDMFNKAYSYAKALRGIGYIKGDEVVICVSNIPEFIYMLLAVSLIGCKANIVGNWFDSNYLKNILNNSKSKYMFVSDDNYEFIKNTIDESNIEKIVIISLCNSLCKNSSGIAYNPYDKIEDKFHSFENKVSFYKNESIKEVIDINDFLTFGNNYNGKVISDVKLDDSFAITYTSGTTDPGCPKGCIHSNRSYVTLSRFKESDVSGMPSMKNLTILAHIPTYTHMELSCAISDTLYEGCTLALEPFYDRDFFIYSLMINKPNFVPASTGFWGNLCKLLNYDDRFKNVDMPYLMIPTVTGEGLSRGEERFFNYTARKHRFGTEKLPFPLAPVTFSIGGGTSESSGIFVTLYRALQEKRIDYLIKNECIGLTPHRFADIEVLDENGEYCKVGEPGLLVANSPCNMIGYTDDRLNKNIYVTDKYGKTWLSLGTYSYKSDNYGRIVMKGRLNSNIYLSNGEKIPYYFIEDTILHDVKNIMSSTVVKTNDNHYVCHIELQPETKVLKEEIIDSLMMRLYDRFPSELLKNLYINIRTSFPVAPSGKRDISSLVLENNVDDFISCKKYFDLNCNVKKKII